MTSRARQLRELLASSDGTLLVPGAPNALSARVVEEAGFDAAYVSGAGVTNTFLGMPDLGLLTVTELARHVAAMADAVHIPAGRRRRHRVRQRAQRPADACASSSVPGPLPSRSRTR